MDVIGVFTDLEKLAEPKPEEKDSKLDPGEQAAMAYNSMARGIMMAVPIAGSIPLVAKGLSNAPAWQGIALRDVKHLSDVTGDEAPVDHIKSPDKKSFLGLFDLENKTKVPFIDIGEIERLGEMQPVVDSFIDKYDLAKKGVTTDFRHSPWRAVRGAYYDPLTKKVTMPRVSKEVLLHELGHAADFTEKAGVLKTVGRGLLPSLMLDGLIPAAYFVGDEIKKAIPGSVDDKIIDFTQRHGPALAMAAMAAKVLYPEGKASYLAIKHIHDVEGSAAAKKAMGKLLPLFGTYALATLPILAGFSMAKKYYYETHKKIEKQAGAKDVLVLMGRSAKDIGDALADVGVQMWRGLGQMAKQPDPLEKLFRGGKEIATSPQFRGGAIYSAVPAAMAAYMAYTHPGGKAQRDKVFARKQRFAAEGKISKSKFEELEKDREFDDWREKNPKKWAAQVGLSAGITGGIMAKLFHDIGQVI